MYQHSAVHSAAAAFAVAHPLPSTHMHFKRENRIQTRLKIKPGDAANRKKKKKNLKLFILFAFDQLVIRSFVAFCSRTHRSCSVTRSKRHIPMFADTLMGLPVVRYRCGCVFLSISCWHFIFISRFERLFVLLRLCRIAATTQLIQSQRTNHLPRNILRIYIFVWLLFSVDKNRTQSVV